MQSSNKVKPQKGAKKGSSNNALPRFYFNTDKSGVCAPDHRCHCAAPPANANPALKPTDHISDRRHGVIDDTLLSHSECLKAPTVLQPKVLQFKSSNKCPKPKVFVGHWLKHVNFGENGKDKDSAFLGKDIVMVYFGHQPNDKCVKHVGRLVQIHDSLPTEDQHRVQFVAIGLGKFSKQDQKFCKGSPGSVVVTSEDKWWAEFRVSPGTLVALKRPSVTGRWERHCTLSMDKHPERINGVLAELLGHTDKQPERTTFSPMIELPGVSSDADTVAMADGRLRVGGLGAHEVTDDLMFPVLVLGFALMVIVVVLLQRGWKSERRKD